MSNFPENDKKFEAMRALKFPIGEYAISSSGPLGIRNIRQIGDIDLVVANGLWDKLAQEHAVIEPDGYKKIMISPDIEAFCEESFTDRAVDEPTILQQIAAADIIDGLAFVNLRHVLYFKEIMGREKDKADIVSIRNLLAN